MLYQSMNPHSTHSTSSKKLFKISSSCFCTQSNEILFFTHAIIHLNMTTWMRKDRTILFYEITLKRIFLRLWLKNYFSKDLEAFMLQLLQAINLHFPFLSFQNLSSGGIFWVPENALEKIKLIKNYSCKASNFVLGKDYCLPRLIQPFVASIFKKEPQPGSLWRTTA